MARKYVLKHACRGISLCASALRRDGYVDAASSEPSGSGNAGAEENAASGEGVLAGLTEANLEEALMPPQLYKHNLWEKLRTEFADWEAQGHAAIQVMCALLSKTKAWTLHDRVTPSLDCDEIALVAPALLHIGADADFVKTTWQEAVLDKYIKLSEEETAKIRQPLEHMIGESMKGSFQMSETSVEKALNSAPGKKKLKGHLHKYFACVRPVKDVLSKGSLSKPGDINEAVTDITACKEELLDFGKELSDVGAITDTVCTSRIGEHLDAMMLKLTKLKEGNSTINHNSLKKAHEDVQKLLSSVDTQTEKQFKCDMKNMGLTWQKRMGN